MSGTATGGEAGWSATVVGCGRGGVELPREERQWGEQLELDVGETVWRTVVKA